MALADMFAKNVSFFGRLPLEFMHFHKPAHLKCFLGTRMALCSTSRVVETTLFSFQAAPSSSSGPSRATGTR